MASKRKKTRRSPRRQLLAKRRKQQTRKRLQTKRELDALGIFEPEFRRQYSNLSRAERELFFEFFSSEPPNEEPVFFVREYMWQKWTYEHQINITATDLFSFDEIETLTEKWARDRMRDVLRTVHSRYPTARLYGGTLLYKRSSDGEKWDKGIVPLYLQWKSVFHEAKREAVSKVGGFYLSMTNPEKFEHAYKVKLVGLAARAMLRRSKQAFKPGNRPTIKGIKSLSREERRRRKLRLL